MDVFFYIFFLLETFLILFAMSTQSNARCQYSRTQMNFKKMSKYGSYSLHPDDIISNHTVHSQTECLMRCVSKSTCVGFNDRTESNKYVVNCQLSKKTYEKTNDKSKKTGKWKFYQDVRATMILGESQLNPEQSCKDVQAANRFAVSRIYWIQHACSKPFQVYCDMETHGGGWTLVYSYTFRNYNSFKDISNAVTPCPNWPVPSIDVPISTTPPLSESSLGALDWKVWKDVGEEFLVKSTVNDWIVCQPNGGSIVTQQDGSVSCANIKNVATACSGVVPNKVDWGQRGLILRVTKQKFYQFEGSTTYGAWPVHDPCGKTETNHKKGVSSPGGQIYLR